MNVMTIIFKTMIVYILVVASMRIMGKRQIGQLQPSELVITLLISEIAAVPIADNNISLKSVALPMATLILFELIISILNIKSVYIRSILQGNSVILIRNGVVDQIQLKKLRYSMDDLLEELRKKNIFDVNEVQYAIAETDGTVSVLPKPEKRFVTPEDMQIPVETDSFPFVVIDDGVIKYKHLSECGHTRESFEKYLRKKNIQIDEILLMCMTSNGETTVIKKDKALKK